MDDIVKAVAAIRRRERYARNSIASPFTPDFRHACCHLWQLRPVNELLKPFAHWWQARFRKRVSQQVVPTAELVEQWCANAAEQETMAVAGATSDWPLPEVHATLFWYEWNTSTWLIAQNAKGLAVPTHLVVEHYLGQLRDTRGKPPWVSRVLAPFGRRAYHHKWIMWFRARWGVKWKRLPLANVLPHDETRRKVGFCSQTISAPETEPSPNAFFDAENSQKKNNPENLVEHGRGPEMDPFRGPISGLPLIILVTAGPIFGPRFRARFWTPAQIEMAPRSRFFSSGRSICTIPDTTQTTRSG